MGQEDSRSLHNSQCAANELSGCARISMSLHSILCCQVRKDQGWRAGLLCTGTGARFGNGCYELKYYAGADSAGKLKQPSSCHQHKRLMQLPLEQGCSQMYGLLSPELPWDRLSPRQLRINILRGSAAIQKPVITLLQSEALHAGNVEFYTELLKIRNTKSQRKGTRSLNLYRYLKTALTRDNKNK